MNPGARLRVEVYERSMPGTSEVHGTVMAGGSRHDGSVSCRLRPAGRSRLCRSGRCADRVRGCPRGPAAGSPRARTYSGQRRSSEHHRAAFAQVRWHIEVKAGAYCKTVGSAYVGSNPTPATTCENGPLARNSRRCGPFLLCPVVCHLVALRAAVSRCLRTHSGRDSCPITVGAHRRLFHGRPRTGRAGGRFLT